jgi:hypothetical protein
LTESLWSQNGNDTSYTSGTVEISNLTGGNIQVSGTISSGVISAGDIYLSGNLKDSSGNDYQLSGNESLWNQNGNDTSYTSGTVEISNLTGGNVEVSGNVKSANVSTGDIYLSGNLKDASGNDYKLSLTESLWSQNGNDTSYTSGTVEISNLTGGNVEVSGNVKSANVFTGDIYLSGNLKDPSGNYYKLGASSNSLWSQNDNGIFYNSNNVGIGTNEPGENLHVNGTGIISNIKFSTSWSNFPDNSTIQSEISNDTGNYKKLMIVGNKSAGGSRQVGVWDNLEVNGKLKVNGEIEMQGGWRFICNSDGHLRIYKGSSQRMVLHNNGELWYHVGGYLKDRYIINGQNVGIRKYNENKWLTLWYNDRNDDWDNGWARLRIYKK